VNSILKAEAAWYPRKVGVRQLNKQRTVTEEGNLQQSLLPSTNISSLFVLQYWRNSDILPNSS